MSTLDLNTLNVLSTVREIADGPNPEDVIHRTLEAARKLLGADGAFWMSVDGSRLVMRAVSGIGRPEVMLNSSLPVTEGIGGKVVSTGQAAWVADYTDYPGRQPDLTLLGQNEGLRSLAAIPVQRGSETTAVLYMLGRTNRAYTQAEVRFLLALSALGATVAAQRAYEESLEARMLALEARLDSVEVRRRAASTLARTLAEGGSMQNALADASNQLGAVIALSVASGTEPDHPMEASGVEGARGGEALHVEIPASPAHFLQVEPTPEADADYFKDLAAIIGLDLAREKAVTETELRLQGTFVEELLTASSTTLGALERRLAAVGLELSGRRQVVALGQSEPVGKRAIDRLVEVVRARHPDVIVASHAGRVIFLWPLDDGVETRAALNRIVTSVRPERFTVGLGGVCSSLGDYPAAVREALFAEQIARNRQTGEPLVDIHETGMYRIFAQVTTLTDLRAAIVPAVGELFAADAKSGSDLVRTLRVYLENDRKLSVVSRILHLHTNTLRYRVDKIARILGIDLDDPDARFFTLMALRLAVEIPESGPSSASETADPASWRF